MIKKFDAMKKYDFQDPVESKQITPKPSGGVAKMKGVTGMVTLGMVGGGDQGLDQDLRKKETLGGRSLASIDSSGGESNELSPEKKPEKNKKP